MATILGDVVGDGPVATVYSGLSDGTPFALKVFPRTFDKGVLAAFDRERARLAGPAATSPILPVDGVEVLADGRQALRMELCARSLATLIAEVGPLAAADAAVLGRAVALGLAAAHRAGVVHGGVSPHNVLFREGGEPVVADFGVSLRHSFPRDPLHLIEFLAPETVRTGVLDERADLYGLGAVLHFALTGRSPHPGKPGEQSGERVLRVLGAPVPAIARQDVPVALSTVVARMLAVDPAHRPPDAATVANLLAEQGPPAVAEGPDFDDFATPDSPAPAAGPDEFDDFTSGPPQARPAPAAGPDEFDDFTSGPPQARPVPVFTTADTAAPPRRRSARYELAVAALLALGLLALVVVYLWPGTVGETTTPAEQTPPSGPDLRPATAVQLELMTPEDRVDHVVLTWTSTADLRYAVVYAEEGQEAKTVLANEGKTFTVQVQPGLQYCFQIRGTDGNELYDSVPKPIRGAECSR